LSAWRRNPISEVRVAFSVQYHPLYYFVKRNDFSVFFAWRFQLYTKLILMDWKNITYLYFYIYICISRYSSIF
jgi:hypothetical protein